MNNIFHIIQDPHYVYFIIDENNKMKVGYTHNNPEKRLKQLQTGSPLKLRLLDCVIFPNVHMARTYERAVHYVLDEAYNKNTIGEWFDSDALTLLKILRSGIGLQGYGLNEHEIYSVQ